MRWWVWILVGLIAGAGLAWATSGGTGRLPRVSDEVWDALDTAGSATAAAKAVLEALVEGDYEAAFSPYASGQPEAAAELETAVKYAGGIKRYRLVTEEVTEPGPEWPSFAGGEARMVWAAVGTRKMGDHSVGITLARARGESVWRILAVVSSPAYDGLVGPPSYAVPPECLVPLSRRMGPLDSFDDAIFSAVAGSSWPWAAWPRTASASMRWPHSGSTSPTPRPGTGPASERLPRRAQLRHRPGRAGEPSSGGRRTGAPGIPAALEGYFGSRKDGYVVVSGLVGKHAYGPQLSDGDWTCVVTIMSPDATTDASAVRTLLLHEWGHSFVTPAIESSRELAGRYAYLYSAIRTAMEKQNYGNRSDTLGEHVLRAVTARIVRLSDGEETAELMLQREEGRGFKYIRPLYKRLALYEQSRDRYPTFADFVPDFLKALGSPGAGGG